jgi:hypothetical protein
MIGHVHCTFDVRFMHHKEKNVASQCVSVKC